MKWRIHSTTTTTTTTRPYTR